MFDPALVPLMPAIPASAYVKHSLKPDGSCNCGDTGCDGPPVHVMVESSSVCSSSKILMPAIQASAKIPYVKHSLKPDGSCICGDTGCDGPPVHVMVESSSVCSSFKIPPISKVTPMLL